MRVAPPAAPRAEGAAKRAEPAGMRPETLVIVFVDLARFQIASRRVKDVELVEILEGYYDAIANGLKAAGGRVIKFMGDGALVVFPPDRVNDAARATLKLKAAVDALLAQQNFVTPLVARVHVGEVMAGAFGPKGDKRYDVIGQAVNRTAAMKLGEVVSLTGDAFARLDAKTKALFTPKGDYYVPA
jgi:adenylate cyclase